jgi:hypothetical protein
MRPKHLGILLVLPALAVASAPRPAHAGGIVSICDQAHLQAALAGRHGDLQLQWRDRPGEHHHGHR